MKDAYISGIRVHPIKALDPLAVDEVVMGTNSLQNDRLFAMVDADGRYINGKRTGKVYQLKAAYDVNKSWVHLSKRGETRIHTFDLAAGNAKLDSYLSDFFDMNVHLVENDEGQFQDMPVVSSVTLVSEASLQALQKDLRLPSLENLRLRFRTNIEISGVEAFWEEQLFHTPDKGVRFKIGDVEMIGISPRARCNVPPKHPATGEMEQDFVKQMMESRTNSLPQHSTLNQFGRNTYFLTINTYLPKTEIGKKIQINDSIEILGTVGLRR